MIYLGKRIEVKIPERGNNGKPNGKFTTIVGICQLEPQSNEKLGVALQTVVDRMPVTLSNLNDIKIL